MVLKLIGRRYPRLTLGVFSDADLVGLPPPFADYNDMQAAPQSMQDPFAGFFSGFGGFGGFGGGGFGGGGFGGGYAS